MALATLARVPCALREGPHKSVGALLVYFMAGTDLRGLTPLAIARRAPRAALADRGKGDAFRRKYRHVRHAHRHRRIPEEYERRREGSRLGAALCSTAGAIVTVRLCHLRRRAVYACGRWWRLCRSRGTTFQVRDTTRIPCGHTGWDFERSGSRGCVFQSVLLPPQVCAQSSSSR